MTSWAALDQRRRGLALVVAAAVLLLAGGWIATLAIESPREAAANAGPPAPSLIAVPVQRRQVAEELVTRGRVSAAGQVEAISPLAGTQARRAVISGKLPAVGDSVRPGQVVVEISGRPVFALPGAVPAYRDLGLGDSGGDVRQLHRALKQAGFAVDPASSRFGTSTQAAVTALYRRTGYPGSGALPAGEVVFVPTMPATVSAVNGRLGAATEGASVRLATGELRVVTQVDAGQSDLVRPGAKVEITSEVLGRSVSATVSTTTGAPSAAEPVPDAGSEGELDARSAPEPADTGAGVVIVPERPLSGAWIDQDVRVRILGASTAAKVLAVPVTAVVSNGSGETEVVVVDAGARTLGEARPRRVQVFTGVTGGGWVEVRPRRGGLNVGDLVQLSAAPGRTTP